MMSEYYCQLYNFLLNIKAWNKLYIRMIMEALTVCHTGRAVNIFMTTSFSSQQAAPFGIGDALGKGS